jgi:SH3 domain protein
MRSGPTDAYRIIGWPKAGEPLQVLEKNEDGTRVRIRLLGSGKEGWITARYVSREPAARVLLQQARDEASNLRQQLARITQQNKALEQQLAQLSGVENRYREKLALLRNQVEVAEQKALRMADTHYNDLFVKGAVVTLVSVLLGVVLGRRNRRKVDW